MGMALQDESSPQPGNTMRVPFREERRASARSRTRPGARLAGLEKFAALYGFSGALSAGFFLPFALPLACFFAFFLPFGCAFA